MAREVYVPLGGAERRLTFSGTRDGIALQKRFGKKPGELLDQEITPVEIVERDGRPHRQLTGYYNPEVVAFALFLGIRHDEPKLTESQVMDWMDQAAQDSQMMTVIDRLFDAFMLSGITGRSVDVDAFKAPNEEKPASEEGAGDQGKAAVVPPDSP